jgi:pyridoxine 5'-phosphate synthase PdxJ
MTATLTEIRDYTEQLDTLSELNERVREIVGRVRGHNAGGQPFVQALKDKNEVSAELGALLVEIYTSCEYPEAALRSVQEAVGQIITAAMLSPVRFSQFDK